MKGPILQSGPRALPRGGSLCPLTLAPGDTTLSTFPTDPPHTP
jgi:hypothetical protein